MAALKKETAGLADACLIQVDGGINPDTVGQVARAGCDVFVAGTAIFGQPDYVQAVAALRRLILKAKEEGGRK